MTSLIFIFDVISISIRTCTRTDFYFDIRFVSDEALDEDLQLFRDIVSHKVVDICIYKCRVDMTVR